MYLFNPLGRGSFTTTTTTTTTHLLAPSKIKEEFCEILDRYF
jgi:hypothetical protein